jgi:hypothetical protein
MSPLYLIQVFATGAKSYAMRTGSYSIELAIGQPPCRTKTISSIEGKVRILESGLGAQIK